MSDRVLVAADNGASSEDVQRALSNAGYRVTLALLDSNALNAGSPGFPDLIIIDTGVDVSGGIEYCNELRAAGYGGPVIFTSCCDAIEFKLKAFQIGADDFVVKPFDQSEFVARVQSAIRRSRIAANGVNGTVIRVDDARLHLGRFTYDSDIVAPVVLTPTEMKILECLMRSHDQSLSRITLIESVWGYEFLGDTNRIDVYIRRIRRKIESDPANPKYLQTVRGRGYMFKSGIRDDQSSSDISAYQEPMA